VTATSMHSRNNRCGYLIGQGYETVDAVKRVGMVVEGINALPAAIAFAEKYEVDMPIVRAVDAIVNHNADPRTVVARLMERDKTAERKG
ncbi:MAG: glycerol-3-phosphate dehydrogenase, partial [Acidaminococcaceae bacterium]|nr:glycerol-3-phosphate dehydrogenase [Acidaminococcaceae bacterium]